MLFIVEDKLKNNPAQYFTFVNVFVNKIELWELQALHTMCGSAKQTLVNRVNCQCVLSGTNNSIISKPCEARWCLCMHLFLPVCVGHSLLLSPALHHGLVLAHPQPPSLNNAGPFGPGFVLVVGVAL